jgi:hypothetical protein
MILSRLLLLASLAAAGCATAPPGEPRPAAVRAVLADAAAQVKRCYRRPRVASDGRQIITRLRVRLGPDGALAGLPSVVAQGSVTPGNRVWADEMAEAASLAVIRCAPLRLPPELYQRVWREIDLTFSPGGLA